MMCFFMRTFICVLMIVTILGVKVYLERANLVSFNPKYLTYAFVNVSRYKRGGEYYVNFGFETKVPCNNDVTVTLRFFEYRWNKYYRSIVEFRHKFCDFIEKDVYIGASIGANGLKCPMKPGKYSVQNVSTNFENFPSALPFEKARFNIMFNKAPSNDLIAEGAVYISVKNNVNKKKQVRT